MCCNVACDCLVSLTSVVQVIIYILSSILSLVFQKYLVTSWFCIKMPCTCPGIMFESVRTLHGGSGAKLEKLGSSASENTAVNCRRGTSHMQAWPQHFKWQLPSHLTSAVLKNGQSGFVDSNGSAKRPDSTRRRMKRKWTHLSYILNGGRHRWDPTVLRSIRRRQKEVCASRRSPVRGSL